MTENILQELKKIEQKEQVTILYAVETGSRAWGFSSTDSDYDVRFIYVRPKTEYLRLEKVRDVIELPVGPIYDINGWDIHKLLRLMHRSNPTVFEWCSSPIVYRSCEYFEQIRNKANTFFNPRAGLYHYWNMSNKNLKQYLQSDTVKLKKYFYVVRTMLACQWVLRYQSPPPMLFETLLETLAQEQLREIMQSLLKLKVASSETKYIPKIPVLNQTIEQKLEQMQKEILMVPKGKQRDWQEIDSLFLEALMQEKSVC